ncbi:MAG: ATP synthase F1 subunit delta [Candidatus Bostrichicola ureolyticus]|nr:MAG: ATP synthase F1 subunit delta [Candidatus Bostrichicola ureolyticus]
MLKLKIAKNYAKGLFEYAKIINKNNELYNDINKFNKLIKTNYVQFFLKYPLKRKEKIELFIKNFTGFSDIYKYIIEFIINNKRENLLEMILFEYKKIYHKNYGILDVTIITSITLNSCLKEKLIKKISNIFNFKKLNIEYLIDKSIIGGLILNINYKQWNLSIKEQLHYLNNKLDK